MPVRGALAGDQVRLIVAIEMHLVGSVNELLTLFEVFNDVARVLRRTWGASQGRK
jgi:hypothetical protein